MHFYNNFRKECLRHGRFDDPSPPPIVLCGIVVAILHVSDRQVIGSPWEYPWIFPWIFPWISTKKKSVDMDVDMEGKFHIHGKPSCSILNRLNITCSSCSQFLRLEQCTLLPLITMAPSNNKYGD